mmetsp:Transcript_13971/g.30916  ORF Transcript_13971/g.30916 Transcript_13971/m.30916 type:complete len:209 (-) Transcript_13971:184-810(-)
MSHHEFAQPTADELIRLLHEGVHTGCEDSRALHELCFCCLRRCLELPQSSFEKFVGSSHVPPLLSGLLKSPDSLLHRPILGSAGSGILACRLQLLQLAVQDSPKCVQTLQLRWSKRYQTILSINILSNSSAQGASRCGRESTGGAQKRCRRRRGKWLNHGHQLRSFLLNVHHHVLKRHQLRFSLAHGVLWDRLLGGPTNCTLHFPPRS